NDDAQALAVGLVAQVGDALDLPFPHQFRDVLDDPGLVGLIGHVGDDDPVPVAADLLDSGGGADRDDAAPLLVGLTDALAAHDDAAGGKVGPLDDLHQAAVVDVRVVDHGHHGVDDLPQVVGRDVGG